MSKKLKAQIIRILRSSGSHQIGGKDPVSALTDKLQMDGGQSRRTVVTCLKQMEEAGTLRLQRSSGRITSIQLVSEDGRIDWTEASPEAKREHRFATDSTGNPVPAHLPDHLCGPVIYSRKENPLEYVMGSPLHETLTLCMKALRQGAVDGVGQSDVRSTLVKYVRNMSYDQAKMFHSELLRLAAVVDEGDAYILRDDDVVTAHEVSELRKKQADGRAAPKPRRTQAEPAEASTQQDVAADEVEQLLGLVAKLEGQIAALTEAVGKLDAALVTEKKRSETLTKKCDVLEHENKQLRVGRTGNKQVAAVLKRHGLS